MHRQAEFVSAIADFVGLPLREDGSPGQAQRVLQPDQAGLRPVISRWRDLLLDLRPGQRAIFAADGPRLAARERCYRSRFQIDEMRALFADDLLAVMGVH